MAYIFVELESVLSDNSHRSDVRRDYATHDALAKDDEPIEDAIKLAEFLNETHVIVVFSTRSELYRMEAEQWLMDNDVPCDEVLMRPEGDYTPAIELKKSMILDYFKGRDDKMFEETFAIISNQENTIEAFREDGFFVISTGWGG